MKSINLKSAVGIALFLALGFLVTVSCKKEKSVFAVADFSFAGNISNLPATIQFTNKGVGLSYTWDFGDGSTSTADNPSHTYTQFGMYKVKLTAQGTNTIDMMVLDVVISIYPMNTVHCNPANPTIINAVLNPITGRIWMDRNLGASRVATSSVDVLAYGDLYQWGRRADGHQCRNSPTISTLSSTNQPTHGSFIVGAFDWRNPSNNNLWQGVNGINNPCPTGFRIPTETEFNAERLSWVSLNSAGAQASPLRLALTGARDNLGTTIATGIKAYFWSSTNIGSNSNNSRYLRVDASNATAVVSNLPRSHGLAVRCIKN